MSDKRRTRPIHPLGPLLLDCAENPLPSPLVHSQISDLAERLVPTPPAPAKAKPHHELAPQRRRLAPPAAAGTAIHVQVLALLAHAPPLRLLEALGGHVVQPPVLDAELPAGRPEVLAVAQHAEVERVWGLGRAREPVRRLALREPVEPEQAHQEPATAPGAHASAAAVAVTVGVPAEAALRARRVVRGEVAVAHLAVEARPAAAAHEAVAAEVRDLEGGHLARDLPELRAEQDERPGELERGPRGDGEEEGVVCRYRAEIGRQDA